MVKSVLNLARPAIRNLVAYSSARSLATEGGIFLDANENPWGEFNRYPEPQPRALLKVLSNLYSVPEDTLFLGRGSDDAIDALVRTFCEGGKDSILICPPTYGVYQVAAEIQGASIVKIPTSIENQFSIEADRVLEAANSNVKLVFVCSPNNPTGNVIPAGTLEKICKGLLGRALLVVDEAYIEFAACESFSSRVMEFPNLVVLRTLSKAFALAGARCGAAIGNPEVIGLLQKVRAPYPISTPSAQVVLQALNPESLMRAQAKTEEIVLARESLVAELAQFDFIEEIFSSRANFVLMKVKSAPIVMETCRKNGIIIRDRSRDEGLKDCVRISVGTPEQNRLVLEALAKVGEVSVGN